MSVILWADGASKGNPGPASWGAILRDPDRGLDLVAYNYGLLSQNSTNNVAEYSALIGGLALWNLYGRGMPLEVRMDSQLIIRQMCGAYRVKDPGMVALHKQASSLCPPGVTWTWVPREQNQEADSLANRAFS